MIDIDDDNHHHHQKNLNVQIMKAYETIQYGNNCYYYNKLPAIKVSSSES